MDYDTVLGGKVISITWWVTYHVKQNDLCTQGLINNFPVQQNKMEAYKWETKKNWILFSSTPSHHHHLKFRDGSYTLGITLWIKDDL